MALHLLYMKVAYGPDFGQINKSPGDGYLHVIMTEIYAIGRICDCLDTAFRLPYD